MRSSLGLSQLSWLLACCLISSTLSSATGEAIDNQAGIKQTVLSHERAALEAFKSHDKKTFAELCLPGFYEITSGGTINTLQDEFHELDDYVLGEYQMSDVVITVPSSTVALIHYKIRAQYVFKGKQLPVETIRASAVWIKQGKEWRAATYQEVQIR